MPRINTSFHSFSGKNYFGPEGTASTAARRASLVGVPVLRLKTTPAHSVLAHISGLSSPELATTIGVPFEILCWKDPYPPFVTKTELYGRMSLKGR
jgi:hypothetical protein